MGSTMIKVKEGMYIQHKASSKVYKALDVTDKAIVMYDVHLALWDRIEIPKKSLKEYVIKGD